jgi:hypothetical protein
VAGNSQDGSAQNRIVARSNWIVLRRSNVNEFPATREVLLPQA